MGHPDYIHLALKKAKRKQQLAERARKGTAQRRKQDKVAKQSRKKNR